MRANFASTMPGESQCWAIASASGVAARNKIDIVKFAVAASLCDAQCDSNPERFAERNGYKFILPARLRHARDEPLRSKLAKSETRNLEAANEGAAAARHLAAIYHPRRAGIARQLRETGIILLRLQLGAHRGVFLHRRALAVVAIDPGGLGHKEAPNVAAEARIATP